jgi:threonine/homoserine/homoserine lactone efflux protein
MESLTLFIVASITLIISPGPDLIYVLTRSISGGKLSGIVSAAGVTSGILVHTMAAALGLALLLQTSTTFFWVVKIIGGVYLIYLGCQMIRSENRITFTDQKTYYGKRRCFLQGFLSNVLNPKVALFFVAFLPQFVGKNDSHQSLQMIVLGLAFAFMTIIFLMIVGFFAGTIGSWLKKKKSVENRIRIGSGTVLIILGLQLLIPHRR